MPELDMLTDPNILRQAISNYHAQQRAKKTYYEKNKEKILAKKRADYQSKKSVADPPNKMDVILT